jgi:hypothetical protein
MWSKMDSDLVDIARKSNLKWNTPLSGCYKAPSDFRLQSVGDFSSNGNIPIVVMLNYDVMLDRLLRASGHFTQLRSKTAVRWQQDGCGSLT